jgi:Mce-associated membrane protein
MHPDSAVVLVFINQSTVSADRPEPALTSSSVLVTVTKASDKWLISSFSPV